ncbi:MAG: hypothetical protein Fur0021_02210 [Candidatus Promineifilaceae bacterium]
MRLSMPACSRSPIRHRRWLRRGAPLLLALCLLLLAPPPASAHPLGNFSINRYSRLLLQNGQILLHYVVDMAEIPTFQEQSRIDMDGDDGISTAEQTAYLQRQVAALQANLRLTLDGAPLPLAVQSQSLTFPAGQGGLDTLRLELDFVVEMPAASSWAVQYEDGNYAGRLGWQEIVVQAGADVALRSSSAPAASISQELRQYPQDLLQNPLTVNVAQFQFQPSTAAVAATHPASSPVSQSSLADRFGGSRFGNDRFADLLNGSASSGFVLATFLVAFGLGALHALSPGHGKTIVGAYLVGSRGTARHALFLGLTTTVTHTAGVFLFGLLVLFASETILPDRLYPWLGVLSGLLVAAIGYSLLRGHWRRLRGSATQAPDHSQETGYHYHLGVGHTHLPANQSNGRARVHERVTWRSLLALGISGGLLPCPSALVVLLSAIALGQTGLGLLLIGVFSLGLASVLTGIGLALVYAGRLLQHFPMRATRLTRLLPVGSALFITLAGAGITVQALLQAGVINY